MGIYANHTTYELNISLDKTGYIIVTSTDCHLVGQVFEPEPIRTYVSNLGQCNL